MKPIFEYIFNLLFSIKVYFTKGQNSTGLYQSPQEIRDLFRVSSFRLELNIEPGLVDGWENSGNGILINGVSQKGADVPVTDTVTIASSVPTWAHNETIFNSNASVRVNDIVLKYGYFLINFRHNYFLPLAEWFVQEPRSFFLLVRQIEEFQVSLKP